MMTIKHFKGTKIKTSLLNIIQSPRTLILMGLIISFFLPWISFGYLIKSAFDIPVSIDEITHTIAFFAKLQNKEIHIPKELSYSYALYLYPALLCLALFIKSKNLQISIAMIPLLPLIIAIKIFSLEFFSYMGWGLFSTFVLAVSLIIEALFRGRFKKKF